MPGPVTLAEKVENREVLLFVHDHFQLGIVGFRQRRLQVIESLPGGLAIRVEFQGLVINLFGLVQIPIQREGQSDIAVRLRLRSPS